MTAELRFRAMGADCHIVLSEAPVGLLELLAARVYELDRRWSRFRPDSELSWLNAHAGEPVAVSQDTLTLVRRGLQGWGQTGGRFDPTILNCLIEAGYDRDFDLLTPPDGATFAKVVSGEGRPVPGPAGIEVRDGTVTLPKGVGFDSGGIGKGLAADLVATAAVHEGASGACVNVGGDIRVVGRPPRGEGWTLSVGYPGRPAPVAAVGLSDGAVATSTTLLRRWSQRGWLRHHLIDPATGAPATGPVVLVSVVAAEAWRAEVLTKAIMLTSDDPLSALVGTEAEGLVIDANGRVSSSPGWASFVGDRGVPALV